MAGFVRFRPVSWKRCRPRPTAQIFAASPDLLDILSGDRPTGGSHLQRYKPARRPWKGGHKYWSKRVGVRELSTVGLRWGTPDFTWADSKELLSTTSRLFGLTLTLSEYSSSPPLWSIRLEGGGGGERLADLVDQLTLECCHSFRFYGSCRKKIPIRDSSMPKRILSQCGVSSDVFINKPDCAHHVFFYLLGLNGHW